IFSSFARRNDMTARKQLFWPLRPATTAHVLDGLAAALSDLIQESGAELADRRARKQLAGLGISVELAPRRWPTGSPRARRRTTICWRRCRSAARTSGDPRIRDWPADHFYQSYDRQKPSSCWKASPAACWHVDVEAALKALFVTSILDVKTDVTEGSSCGPLSFAKLHSLRISPRLSGPDSRPPLPGCSMSTGNSVPPTRSCCWASMSRAAPPWSVTGMAGR